MDAAIQPDAAVTNESARTRSDEECAALGKEIGALYQQAARCEQGDACIRIAQGSIFGCSGAANEKADRRMLDATLQTYWRECELVTASCAPTIGPVSARCDHGVCKLQQRFLHDVSERELSRLKRAARHRIAKEGRSPSDLPRLLQIEPH